MKKIVEKMWFAVQNNIGKFQKYFGSENFEVVDNSNYFEKNSKEEQDFKMYLFKLGKKIIESPLKNKIGIKTIEMMKKNGYKYLSDFLKEFVLTTGEKTKRKIKIKKFSQY